MTSMEYLDEYIDEELLQESINYEMQHMEQEELIPNESLSHEDEYVQFLNAGTSSKEPDVKPARKAGKRKSTSQPPVKKSKGTTKKDPSNIGDVMKLYAYKDCLGKFDSLIRNPDMPLWYRDGSSLFQKYLRQRCDNDGLFYYSTQIYSCWEEERADEYIELDAEIVIRKNINFVVKIRNIDMIEEVCSDGNFKDLGLMPYTNYQMRVPENLESDDPKVYTIKIISNSDIDVSVDDNDDNNTSNDVTEEVEVQHIESSV